ncbi:MAG: serine/threonine protein kinase [Planctomycetes bacterium]|nr:serine/threonine protein kinase [Planctomycetota bacterium]
MDPARFAAIRLWFERLAPLDAAARQRGLAAIDDLALRAEVLRMLEVDMRRDAPLDAPAATLAAPLAPSDDPIGPGTRIERYVVVRRIGGGGMGSVFEATQDEPRRTVALKLLRLDTATHEAILRFRAEAELLGRIDHPRVARIHEAGTYRAADGTLIPFLALEYVRDSLPLTRGLDARRANLATRLRVLADVADAIHHGHLKGVVHRDVKSGNVLLDGDGIPHVIDFGIGRIVDASYESGPTTRTGQMLGTPAAMSPEQFRGDPKSIDARTDIWSLGVLAYEVLCGRAPFETADASITAIARAVTERTPTPPSRIAREVPKAVDWVLGKALEKDPQRRYASAAEFAADLRRLLTNEPVLASPPSVAYRTLCFVRRHRLGVAAGALVVASLVACGVATWLGKQRAERESARARGANQVLFDVLQSASAMPKGPETPVGDVVRTAIARADKAFRDDVEARGFVHVALGASQLELGESEQALATLRAGYDALASTRGVDDVEAIGAAAYVVHALLDLGRLDEAQSLLDSTAPIAVASLGKNHAHTYTLRHHAALLAHHRGDDDAAIAALRTLVADEERSPGEGRGLRRAIGSLAVLVQARGDLAEATALHERVVVAAEAEDGPTSLESDFARKNLASVLVARGEYARAEPLLRTAIEHESSVFGPRHEQTLATQWNLMQLLHQSARTAEAVELGERVLDGYVERFGADSSEAALAQAELGSAYLNAQRPADALRVLTAALATFTRELGSDHVNTLTVRGNRVSAMLKTGAADGIVDEAQACVTALVAKVGDDHPATLAARYRLAEAARNSGSPAIAITELERVAATQRTRFGADHWQTIQTEAALAMSHASAGDLDAAESLLRGVVARASTAFPAGDWRPHYFRFELGDVLHRAGRFTEAEPELRAGYDAMAAALPAASSYVRDARALLATFYRATGRADLAATFEEREP